MAEGVSNLSAKWVDGSLYFYDSGMTAVLIVSSTGFDLRGGSNTISTASLVGSSVISTAALVGTLTGSTNALLKTVDISTAQLMSCVLSTSGIVGKMTASTNAIISGCPISTAVLSAPTISSGVTRDGEKIVNKTGNATLVKGEAGAVITCSTDSVFITLPSAASTGFAGANYTIRNIATTGQNVIVITATGDSIIGGGITTSNVIRNVSTTHLAGDEIRLVSGASTTWWLMGMVGTWASTT